jgi:hypothetical protein
MMINFRDILYAPHYNKSYFRRIFPTNTSLGKVTVQVNEVETTRVSDYVGPEIRKVIHFRSSRKLSQLPYFEVHISSLDSDNL